MRMRLRAAYSAEERAALYGAPYDHTRWLDHRMRMAATAAVAAWVQPVESLADLSCGDGALARRIAAQQESPPHMTLGDLTPCEPETGITVLVGPIENTIEALGTVDLFVCTETLEHVDDPDALLQQIRLRARHLLISTPVGETLPINPEHYWGWGTADVEAMLRSARWTPKVSATLDVRTLDASYQIWGCS